MSNLNKAGSRRLVTFLDDLGRSRISTDKNAPHVVEFAATPGMRTSVLWATSETPVIGSKPNDPVPILETIHPSPGGSVFMILTLPPDSLYTSEVFDPTKSVTEQLQSMPGIVERMEPDNPGFHRTDTLDYIILLSGELWLVTDDDEARIRPGDVVVQLGARHAWQNRTDSPATIAVVLLGATSATR